MIETCDNKAKQYLELSKHGIPMPETIIAPKVYPNFTIKDSGYYEQVLERLGLPMIIKEGHGSFGMKVYLIETEEQFYEKTDELRGVDYVFQKFIASSRGRDIRVNIVGGEIVAAMYRHSETDFRANITNGGVATDNRTNGSNKKHWRSRLPKQSVRSLQVSTCCSVKMKNHSFAK